MKQIILKVLILGGTNFLGPHLVETLHEHGHEVTLFHRGTPSPHSFEYVHHLYGDRNDNLQALKDKKWDAIIDTSGYLPRTVEASSQILAKAAQHYTFISTIGVYENFLNPNINEDYPLAKLEDESNEEISEKTYGALKARCEEVIQRYFSNRSLIIRPGLIVGPYDQTDRFTYWVNRIAEGGEIVAPADPQQLLQFIDVRDLANWIVEMVEKKATGIYNATGPANPLTFEQFLNACIQQNKKPVQIYWLSEQFLLDQQVQDWTELPMWLSSQRKMPGFQQADIRRAIKAGLSFRPLSETIADTLAWDLTRNAGKRQAGLEREKEKKLLQMWKNEFE